MIRAVNVFLQKAAGGICFACGLFVAAHASADAVNFFPRTAFHAANLPVKAPRAGSFGFCSKPVTPIGPLPVIKENHIRDGSFHIPDTLPIADHDTTAFSGIPPQPVKGRIWALGGVTAAVYANSLLVLNKFWYSGYPQRSFHTFNDAGEWLQMDKAGHVFSAYMLSKYSRELWRWSGLPRKSQIWIGGMSGLAYQSVVELLDAHSGKWGWSWSDMAANVFGVSVMMSQELAWNEQRFQLKFSSFPVRYKDPVLKARALDQFGNSLAERTLKDYNSQTYWLSLNLKSVMPESNLPRWLNIAVGYSADNLFDDYSNHWTDAAGVTHDYTWLKRKRQLFLSPDIDLTKIRTRHKGVKVLFQVLNMIKIPAPALELDLNGRLKMHALYF